MAKNEGKIFEQQFKKSLEKINGMKVLRLVDPPSSFGKDSRSVRFSIKNPYDFECYKYPYLYCLELKSKQNGSLSFQTEEEAKLKKLKDIKYHQYKSLLEASSFEGVYAGFVINFRDTNRTYWINIIDFDRFIKTNDKKSINEKDCQSYGTQISQHLIRTTYAYDIDLWLDRID